MPDCLKNYKLPSKKFWERPYTIVVRTLDAQSKGPGLDSHPLRCRVQYSLQAHAPPSITLYHHKLGGKQAHRATHWPRRRVHGPTASGGVWLKTRRSASPWLAKGLYNAAFTTHQRKQRRRFVAEQRQFDRRDRRILHKHPCQTASPNSRHSRRT